MRAEGQNWNRGIFNGVLRVLAQNCSADFYALSFYAKSYQSVAIFSLNLNRATNGNFFFSIPQNVKRKGEKLHDPSQFRAVQSTLLTNWFHYSGLPIFPFRFSSRTLIIDHSRKAQLRVYDPNTREKFNAITAITSDIQVWLVVNFASWIPANGVIYIGGHIRQVEICRFSRFSRGGR